MKHSAILVFAFFWAAIAYAQTNTFPTTGNVGIGTLTPANKLTVLTASNATGIVHTDGTVKVGTYVSSGAGWLGTVSNHPLYFYTNNGLAQVTLATGGLFGIGTTSPGGKLDVRGGDAYLQGVRAGTGNSNDSTSTCFGKYTLGVNTGTGNTAVGYNVLYRNTSGISNTAVGTYSMFFNGIGVANTAMGHSSLVSNTTGSGNTAIGLSSMYGNVKGLDNTAIGQYSLRNNDTGRYNAAVGVYSLNYNTTGLYNTGVGYMANTNAFSLNNATAIGSNATATASNQVRIGNSSVTSIGGYVGWTNISDGRVKNNIKENVPGLQFINLLKPVTYNLDLDAAQKIITNNELNGKIKLEERAEPAMAAAKKEKEQMQFTGFIAQDVEKAAKSINYNFSGVDAPKNDKDMYGIRYAEFVVPLVKAVQELSEENERLKAEISEIKAMLKTNIKVPVVATGSLGQNIPNPSNNSTTIHYVLPAKYMSASITITNSLGEKVKAINLSGNGKGSILLDTGAMSTGAFQYSLYINNGLVETKQMIVAK